MSLAQCEEREYALVPWIFVESAVRACVVAPPRNPDTRAGTFRKISSTRTRRDFSCAPGHVRSHAEIPHTGPGSPSARDFASLHVTHVARRVIFERYTPLRDVH